MTQPQPRYDLGHRYSMAEWDALPEDNSVRYELQKGRLIVCPQPLAAHNKAIARLCAQLDPQLPAGLHALPEIEVRLVQVPPTVRVPDVVVTTDSVVDRATHALPEDVLLAVEVLSPSSIRTDWEVKLLEYAEAGIPQYWVVDPRPPITATVYLLIGGSYKESQRAEGVFEVTEPCPLRIDLNALRLVKTG